MCFVPLCFFNSHFRVALYYACCNGAFATAALLVDLPGADLNCADREGDTPLHGAMVNGHVECVQLLLRCGADPNLTNHSGHTPAYYASDGNMLEVSACVYVCTCVYALKRGVVRWQVLFEGGGNLFCVDEHGRTLLFEVE